MPTADSVRRLRASIARTRSWTLVVDDSREVREAIAEYLSTAGHEVKCADGLQALRLLREMPAPPGVVLLDWMMPDVSGMEILQRLRADPRTQRCVVVVVTGLGAVTAKESELAEWGVAKVMRKPVSGRDLLAVVDEAERAARSP